MTTAFIEQATELASARGKRMTPTRQQVLRIIADSERCIGAYDILAALQLEHPNTKPTTVYRALEFLESEGFIHRLDALNGWMACNDIEDAHHHSLLFVCTGCGSVTEIPAPELSHKLNALLREHGYIQSRTQTEIGALCRACQTADVAVAD